MDGFKKFLLRGSVVDLAVAVVIGAAFAGIVTGVVRAFVTPLVGLIAGSAGDFSKQTFEVSGIGGKKVIFPYGQFVQATISFLMVATVVYFFVVKPVQRLLDRFATQPAVGPTEPVKQCPECLSKIPAAARRCAFCAVQQLDAA